MLAPGSGSVLRNRVHAGGRCALGPEKTSQPDAERRTGERRPCPEPTVQARRRDPPEERAQVTTTGDPRGVPGEEPPHDRRGDAAPRAAPPRGRAPGPP